MHNKMVIFICVVFEILQLISLASSKDHQSLLGVLQDFTQADGFIFDGPAGRSSSPSINTNINNFNLSSISTPAPGTVFGRRKTSSHISTFPHCFKNCSSTLVEKKPVCGNDGVTYDSAKQVHCARMCGKYVQIKFEGPCVATTTFSSVMTEATTISSRSSSFFSICMNSCPKSKKYNPICGSDGVTYESPEIISCAQVCGRRIEIASHGICT